MSECVGICVIEDGYCIGCGRSQEEIENPPPEEEEGGQG
ncbi:DUF1289 domain-containing protein [Telmatospirillum sp. J64-1]|nr:DUF1289 domain-containing protein [Telmatospirillum sp. J64-1]